MKICHVAHQSWPGINGSVSRLSNILKAQKSIGITPFVVSSPYQDGLTTNNGLEVHDGISYYRTAITQENLSGVNSRRTFTSRVKRGLALIPFTYRLFKICKKLKPQVIHAHATFAMGIPSIIVGYILKLPVVYEMRSTWEDDFDNTLSGEIQKKIVKTAEYLTGKFSNHVVAVSHGIICHYFPSKEPACTIIHNCVPSPSTFPKPNPSNIYTFGYIGTLTNYEGLEFLLQAAEKISTLRQDFKITIFGDGDTKHLLEKISIELNIQHLVEFRGRISHNDISLAYSEIDCIVLPRRNLPITQKVAGLKPIEAFSYKKLVISARVGGMQELFTEDRHGIMFTPESVPELVKAMQAALTNDIDYSAIIIAAYNHYKKNYTLEAMGTRYLKVYNSIL